MAVEHAAASSHRQLGQLAPLVEDSNLLALLLGKLSLGERCSVARVCRRLCQKVRAAVAFKLALHGRDAEVAAAMPSCRAFTGAVQVTCKVGSSRKKYRGMVALMRYAADNWPYLTHVALACVPNCPALTSNPGALWGPLQSLAAMPHLASLSLSLPRLDRLDMAALAALTGLTRLELSGSHRAQLVFGVGIMRDPMCMAPGSMLPLVNLQQLELVYVAPYRGTTAFQPPPLPPSLTAVTITPAATVEGWIPALAACQHLQQLEVQYDISAYSNAPSLWQLLVQLAPRLIHLTTLTVAAMGSRNDSLRPELLTAGACHPLPAPCFAALCTFTCYLGMSPTVMTVAQWRLLAACPALRKLRCVAAKVAPPPDLGQLGLTRLHVLLYGGRAEAGALLRHCPLVEEVEVLVRELLPTDVMPQTLPLVLSPLRNLRHVSMRLGCSRLQLVEVLAPSLSTTRSLELTMPLGKAGILPDLSSFCQLTRLVYTVPYITAAGEQKYPLPDDLLWCLRGCGGLVELTLVGCTWLDACLALAAAGAHPALRLLRLVGCGVLPASSMCEPKQRLENIRCLLRPSLRLVVV